MLYGRVRSAVVWEGGSDLYGRLAVMWYGRVRSDVYGRVAVMLHGRVAVIVAPILDELHIDADIALQLGATRLPRGGGLRP